MIWLVVWNIFTFPYIGNSHSNWLIFFRGVDTTNQWFKLDLNLSIRQYHPLWLHIWDVRCEVGDNRRVLPWYCVKSKHFNWNLFTVLYMKSLVISKVIQSSRLFQMDCSIVSMNGMFWDCLQMEHTPGANPESRGTWSLLFGLYDSN